MSDMSRMARENAEAFLRPRPPIPIPSPWKPRLSTFRPPLLRAPWLRDLGAVLAIVGSCAIAVGLPCAIVGIWVPSWLAAGLWCSGAGLVLMVAGLVMGIRR